MVLKDPPLPKLSLVAMIDADSLLFFPDFKADERLFQHFLRAALLIENRSKATADRKVMVQTFHPESNLFQNIKELSSEDFSKKILRDRESLFYPPFSRLVALSLQGKTKEESETKGKKIYTELEGLALKKVKIHPPQTSQFLKRKNLFESTVLIRLPADDEYPQKFIAFLRRISKDCTIDVDPISFR